MGAWGHDAPTDIAVDLFQSDHDYDIVSELTDEAGLYAMEDADTAQAEAEGKEVRHRVHYSIYAYICSNIDLVRGYLDSGVLAKLIEDKEAKLLAPTSKANWGRDPCYVYVLLGACAMSLGCQLPDLYIAMLKKVYTEGGLMPGALRQMNKALFGPDGFENGVPYDFESKGLLETANTTPSAPNSHGVMGMNVIGPGGFFDTGMGDSTTSKVIKELREQNDKPNVCGGCGAKEGPEGGALLQCGRCKLRKYCGSECQKKHWKVHKKICEPVKQ